MAKSKEILRHPYIRVGRLKMNIAKAAHLKSADIYVSENYIKHIENKHHVELTKIGFTAFDFVTHICDKYNQIREGSDDSYLLVLYNEKLPYVASISLNYSVYTVNSSVRREIGTLYVIHKIKNFTFGIFHTVYSCVYYLS